MQTKVFDMAGKQVGEIELSDAIFGIEPNEAVVHDVVKNHLANCRQGTQSALTRAEVSGGGIKPWRQKGTGRARQGSIRAPQWYSRRHRVCTEAPRLQLHAEQEGQETGPQVRPVRQGAGRRDRGDRRDQDGLHQDQDLQDLPERRRRRRQGSGCHRRERRQSLSRALPTSPAFWSHSPTLINVYDILNAKKLVVDKAALAKIEEVFA